jgi:hypothetical protein
MQVGTIGHHGRDLDRGPRQLTSLNYRTVYARGAPAGAAWTPDHLASWTRLETRLPQSRTASPHLAPPSLLASLLPPCTSHWVHCEPRNRASLFSRERENHHSRRNLSYEVCALSCKRGPASSILPCNFDEPRRPSVRSDAKKLYSSAGPSFSAKHLPDVTRTIRLVAREARVAVLGRPRHVDRHPRLRRL